MNGIHPYVLVLVAVATSACGARSLALQRESATVVTPGGVTCVRPAEETDFAAQVEAGAQYEAAPGAPKAGATARAGYAEQFRLKESPRARCLRRAAGPLFRACLDYANGALTRDEYLQTRRREEAACDGLAR